MPYFCGFYPKYYSHCTPTKNHRLIIRVPNSSKKIFDSGPGDDINIKDRGMCSLCANEAMIAGVKEA